MKENDVTLGPGRVRRVLKAGVRGKGNSGCWNNEPAA